jgi:hypothetical protein
VRLEPGSKLDQIHTRFHSLDREPDSTRQIDTFLEAIKDFEDCVVTENHQSVLRRAVPLVFDFILESVEVVLNNFDAFWQTAQILSVSQAASNHIPPAHSTTQLFLGC